MNKIFQVVTFVSRKIYNSTKSINQLLEAPVAMVNKWTDFEKWVTKVFGATSTLEAVFKGHIDLNVDRLMKILHQKEMLKKKVLQEIKDR